jgi:hypothetical protein
MGSDLRFMTSSRCAGFRAQRLSLLRACAMTRSKRIQISRVSSVCFASTCELIWFSIQLQLRQLGSSIKFRHPRTCLFSKSLAITDDSLLWLAAWRGYQSWSTYLWDVQQAWQPLADLRVSLNFWHSNGPTVISCISTSLEIGIQV